MGSEWYDCHDWSDSVDGLLLGPVNLLALLTVPTLLHDYTSACK